MATTLTTILPTGKNFPIIGPPSSPEMFSPIPGAQIIYNEIGAAITVAAGAADQKVIINMTLPRGYSYALIECNARIVGLDAADWEDLMTLEIDDDNVTPKILTHMQLLNPSGEVSHSSTTILSKIYQVLNPLQKVIRCDGGADGRLQIVGFNPVVDGTLMTIDFYAALLRFSLNQGFHYGVNTPVPVR